MEKKYSFWKGVRKVGLQAIIFGTPMLLNVLPHEWMNLTIAGLIGLIVNAVKVNLASEE